MKRVIAVLDNGQWYIKKHSLWNTSEFSDIEEAILILGDIVTDNRFCSWASSSQIKIFENEEVAKKFIKKYLSDRDDISLVYLNEDNSVSLEK